MTNFRLIFERKNINEDYLCDLFQFKLSLISDDSKIKFLVVDQIEYSMSQDDRFNICRGGHGYLDSVDEQKNIECFFEKLKTECYPIEYKYNHEYSSPYEAIRKLMNCELNITIDKESTTINDNVVPTSKMLIESITHFFKNILEYRNDFEKEAMNRYGYLIEQVREEKQ